MDHLILPAEPAYVPIKVPCLCTEMYDRKGFSSYPERCGFTRACLREGHFTEHSPAKTAAFLQSWLYFGLLAEFLGAEVQFDLNDFLANDSPSDTKEEGLAKQENSQKFISTAKLPALILSWTDAMRGLPRSERENRFRAADDC